MFISKKADEVEMHHWLSKVQMPSIIIVAQ